MQKTIQLWLIRVLLGTEAVGLYSFGMGILGQVVSFLPFASILTSLLPKYIDRSRERLQLFASSIKAQTLISVLLLGIACGIAPVMFWLFPRYVPAEALVYWILVGTIPGAIVSVYTPWFMTLQEQYDLFLSMLWKLFLSVLALVVGIGLFGVPGIGVGVAVAMYASLIERTVRIRHLHPSFVFPNPVHMDSLERDLMKSVWSKMSARIRSVRS